QTEARLEAAYARETPFERVHADLILVPAFEDGIDRDQPEAKAELAGPQHRRLSETDDGNLATGAQLPQSRVLEVTEDDRVDALSLGLQRTADRLHGAAPFGHARQVPVGRIDAAEPEREA